jgi:hypothetical protein
VIWLRKRANLQLEERPIFRGRKSRTDFSWAEKGPKNWAEKVVPKKTKKKQGRKSRPLLLGCKKFLN